MLPTPAKDCSVVRAATTNTRAMGNGLVSLLLPSAATGGAFAFFEATMRSGAEPPPHAHHERFTLFYIVEGELEAHCNEEVRQAKQGDAVLLPPGSFHTYKVLSPTVNFLVFMQPGDQIEGYFEEMSQPVTKMELPDPTVRPLLKPEEIQELAERYGFTFDLTHRD